MTALELVANGIMTASIVLAGRNNVNTWWTGIAGSVLFAVLFYQNQLYADVLLQFFFIFTSAAGWATWAGVNAGVALVVTRAEPMKTMFLTILAGIVVVVYGLFLSHYTNAYAPFWDSAILAASVVAQLLLMNRKVETWYFWLLVNTVAVPLYCSRGLFVTALLYAGYWLNAFISLRKWNDEFRLQTAQAE